MTATVLVRDLVKLNAIVEELNRYFHQPMHYPHDPNVALYMSKDGGDAYSLIQEAYYKLLREMVPPEIEERIGDDEFRPSEAPYYFSEANVLGPA